MAIYAFISGYAIYKKCHNTEDENYNIFKALLKYYKTIIIQLFNFLKKYWIVFVIFVPMGFILGIYDEFSWTALVGLSSKYNGEWWYVRQYIGMLLLAPFLCCLGDLLKYKNKIHWVLVAVILAVASLIVSVCVQHVTYLLNCTIQRNYSFIFCLGYIVAISGIFEKVSKLFENHEVIEIIIAICGVFICFVVRSVLADSANYSNIDIVLVAPFIYCVCVIIGRCKWIGKFLYFLGKYSVYMWLVHTFYCYYYFQTIITISKISTVMYIELFAISLVTAFVLSLIEHIVNFIINKIKGLKLWDKLRSQNAL